MPSQDAEIESLLGRAAGGDRAAWQELLLCHERRLRGMIAVRLDRRLAARLDPSDVVQEVFADACREMADYLCRRPLPFYPWLRQLAWERLVKLHQRHIRARKRSVTREEAPAAALSDESALALAERLAAPGANPSSRLLREELSGRVRGALDRLAGNDREVLVLRYLEQLSTREIAAVLGLSEGAVKVRHLRALERLRHLLSADPREDES